MTASNSLSVLVTFSCLVQAVSAATCWFASYWDPLLQETRYRSKYCASCCGSYGRQFCCNPSAVFSDSVIAGPVVGAVVLLGVVVAAIVCIIYQKRTVRRRMVRSTAVPTPPPPAITMISMAPGTTQHVTMTPPSYPWPAPPSSYSGTSYPAVYPTFQNADPAYPMPIVLSYQMPQGR